MKKITSIADLNKIKEQADFKEYKINPSDKELPVLVKVAMATCGIASGAKETMDYFMEELKRRQVPAIVSQTGCMSYCYAEPTVEVTIPGREPVIFGYVNSAKAQEIIDVYIVRGEMVDGIIPDSYKTV
jgi:NADP-reducing hydrogenase subunit HndB